MTEQLTIQETSSNVKALTTVLGGLKRPGFLEYYLYKNPDLKRNPYVRSSIDKIDLYNTAEDVLFIIELYNEKDNLITTHFLYTGFIKNLIETGGWNNEIISKFIIKIIPKRLTYLGVSTNKADVVFDAFTYTADKEDKEDVPFTVKTLYTELLKALEEFDARPSLFKPRKQVLPYEYPNLIQYSDAIRHSYWLHTEFTYTSDIQNYYSDCTEHEKNVVTRAMLAISQIEVDVKRFWGDIYYLFPKPEMDLIGGVFFDSETRHFDAYRNLLELLGMNTLFTTVPSIEPLQARVNYIGKFMKGKKKNQRGAILSTTLFSLFVEHISLFSQFLIMMSFNKERNLFKGLSNAIEATSKEEEIHGKFGIEIINILKEENPELFTDELYQELSELAKEAFEAEMKIVDWIFDGQDLTFLSIETVKNYIRKRYNNSLAELGLPAEYVVVEDEYKKVEWFDVEVLASKENDFFNKRSTDYSKKGKAITADDLF